MIELGSSDAPSIMGCGFQTPYQLWLEKSGLIEHKDESNEIMDWGTRLQHEVLCAFAEQQRSVIVKEQPTEYSHVYPWMRATPDGVLMRYHEDDDGERIVLVEVKCCVNQPPPVPRVSWVIQALHQRNVWESIEPVESQYIVAFGGLRMVSWEVPFHPKAMYRVLNEELRFLDRIERMDPPPLRAEDASVLHRLWPWSKPETVMLDAPGMVEADELYVAACAAAKDAERCKGEVQAAIKAAMEDRQEAVLLNGARYTWKTGKDGQRRFRRMEE